MRALVRLPEPITLANKKTKWLNAFLASGKNRPDSSKYANQDVCRDLTSMSSFKCFYCETKLKGARKEVDHHIEVSVDSKLSFEWRNLNLACTNCNAKIPHDVIAITDVLDPCKNTDIEIQAHLTFRGELIEPKNNSIIGQQTIKKFRLESESLDTKRLKEITIFLKVLIQIQQNQIKDGRNSLTVAEKTILEAFKRSDQPYSLMFTVLLAEYGL